MRGGGQERERERERHGECEGEEEERIELTHMPAYTIVTGHNSEVTAVFFSTTVPVGGACEQVCVRACVPVFMCVDVHFLGGV